MDSLDLSTHQLILNELAVTLASQASHGKLSTADTAALYGSSRGASGSSRKVSGSGNGKYLNVTDIRTQIGLAQFASSIAHSKHASAEAHLAPVLRELTALLAELSNTELEESMDWQEWCLPDQLACALVASMLRVANAAPQHRDSCVGAILTLAQRLSDGLSATAGDAHIVAVRLVPLFHGFYRAVASFGFQWGATEFARLATALAPLTSTAQTVRRLNDALLILPEQEAALQQANRATRRKPKAATVRPNNDDEGNDDGRSEGSVDTFFSGDDEIEEDELDAAANQGGFVDSSDSAAFDFRTTLLLHYRKVFRPLSGHFVLCAVIEVLASVLSQLLAAHIKTSTAGASKYSVPAFRRDADEAETLHLSLEHDASATRKAWKSLLANPVADIHVRRHNDMNNPQAPETSEVNTTGSTASRIVNALPIIINGGNGSAAFRDDSLSDALSALPTSLSSALSQTLHMASRAYHDVHRFVDNEGSKQRSANGDLHMDIYALEILAESLKLGALCSVAQARAGASSVGRNVNSHTLVRVRTLLSEQASVFEPVLQGAALQATGFLVLNFPAIALPMTTQLRRFVTSPLAMFGVEPASTAHTMSPILASAAKALCACVTAHGNDDLVVSTMYTLLNYLGKDMSFGGYAAGGAAGSGISVRSGASRAVSVRDHAVIGGGMHHAGSLTSFATRTEEQKVAITASTIATVSRLAIEVGQPDVIALTTSMLLQRLRTAEAHAEAALLVHLVPLAVAGSKVSFVEVVRALINALRSAMSGGAGRRASQAAQQALLRLAQRLGQRQECEEGDTSSVEQQEAAVAVDVGDNTDLSSGRKEIYLVELLQLFAEKGQQLQTAASSGKASKEELAELNTDLANLLPTISALLAHSDINPQLKPTVEMVSLFRNMWFLSILFGYAMPPTERRAATSARAPGSAAAAHEELVSSALASISLKTPTLVPETAHNYLESDLEYNSVLKRDFSAASIETQRRTLAVLIPSHTSEIRSFKFAELTFLQTIFNLECMRSSLGRPSMILWYFVNDGLNSSSLVGSMEAIADKVMQQFIADIEPQLYEHALDPRVSAEVRNLLLGSVHRVSKVRVVSRKFLDRLIGAYPSLLCDGDLVILMLEMLTLVRHGCESEYRDEYSPVYHFHSERANVAFDMSDSYPQREEILRDFLQRTRTFLGALVERAPVELQGILQRYLSTLDDTSLPGYTELGKSVALEYAKMVGVGNRQETFLPPLGGWTADTSSTLVNDLVAKSNYMGEVTGIHLALTNGLVELRKDPKKSFSTVNIQQCKQQLADVSRELLSKKPNVSFAETRRLLYRTAALAVALPEIDFDFLHYVVSIPIRLFTPASILTASHVWTWIIGERPTAETKIMVEVTIGWLSTIQLRKGIFSKSLNSKHPLLQKTEMSAFDRQTIVAEREAATRLFTPHLILLRMISSRYQAFHSRDPSMVLTMARLLDHSARSVDRMSTHPLAREVRFTLVHFGLRLLQGSKLDGLVEFHLRQGLYKIAFAWFAECPQWSFGSNRLQVQAEMRLLSDTLKLLASDKMRASQVITSFPADMAYVRLPGRLTVAESSRAASDQRLLLSLLVESELSRFSVWNNPMAVPGRGSDFVGNATKSMTEATWASVVRVAWSVNPQVAVQMTQRFKSAAVTAEAGRLVRADPGKVVRSPDALGLLTESHLQLALREGTDLRWLLYWAAVTPVEGIELFSPKYGNNPMLLQYAMRALEELPVELTFFYVPQVVQALRSDEYGYVEQFIFETSKISQLFCHQIIWNMKANSYKDDNAGIEDPMKPTLDRMIENIVHALSGESQKFYNREFGFFDEITSISGKLKPYIKKSKQEKKAKIDEEMAKIKVDPGVYLPSNSDGVVVDIDRKSGRPLQSHAKAPFMATFKVHRDVLKPGAALADDGEMQKEGVDVWQAALFKVGDDCRQDALALQVIAMFKNIFTNVGLDLYLNPYCVVATGPGCGIIDAVPNATSRDEMGRAKINNLLSFFIGKYGNPDGIAFQKARLNFIQSMAAYSLACYILQIKDRHNGNIMIDGDGHIVHVDFGFLFDIGPGGMKFEPNSFKLSHEMVMVMGGAASQGFKMFSELVVKGFLAIRPYAKDIISVCHMMLGTDLPSFKGEPTIHRLRDRFKLEMTERQAAKWAEGLIADGFENPRSTFYDGFQKLQNGIPY
ncbi:hypothetical protein K437DRAFT_253866 [Tilletiaria anomala UBC 951]|uniref:1-phosphatidylinositol 4-kinase n=1 Tax=Tilletiaria anomala (strain ATCC 24038 / CBS 436.72 / UBC 951) TaxID=1037660 RepID=A0A066WNU3_TILAU|nr:uncharacterized protein K437DRAFT_253866 [Tilletiaria anomala UBC 951]KDN52674.1 hypothetical protein K437DRAFT_253866 [Tilletiaria anomala UBC 951]